MKNVFIAYDLDISGLIAFYSKLNTPVAYPDGMQVTLDTLYWGREKHYPDIAQAIDRMQQMGIAHLSQLLDAVRTPARAKKFTQLSAIPEEILRVLKHDIALWLPQPVQINLLEPIQKYAPPVSELGKAGIGDQLQMISMTKTQPMRESLAEQTGIPLESIVDITRCCDFYRTGRNLDHIRSRIYYDMGFDTWQKWASSTSEEIITRFTDYIKRNNLESERLIPWPREVRNGIEWARLHLSIYAVEWQGAGIVP